jgi:hypothetical protein
MTDLVDVRTPGKMVKAAVVDAIMREEEVVFHGLINKSLEAQQLDLGNKVLFVRMYDSEFLSRVTELHGSANLAEKPLEAVRLQGGKGNFEKIRTQLGLQDPISKLLVAIPIPGNLHFSMCLWLPSTGELFHLDSHRSSNHTGIVESVLMPFLEFLNDATLSSTSSPLVVVSKDDSNGIEQQPTTPSEESNVCGFAAPFFLSKALAVLLDLVDTGEHNMLSLGTALSKGLHELTISSSAYKARRRLGRNDIVRLTEDYRLRRDKLQAAKEVQKKAQPSASQGTVVHSDSVHSSPSASRCSSPPRDDP